jgi:hypothetical protein
VVGGHAIHILGLFGNPAKKIAPADNDRHLDAKAVYVGKFSRDFMNAFGVHSETLIGCEGFAGDF